jgi:hypothetical protein
MKLLKNSGNDRVLDELRSFVQPGSILDICSPVLSLFAFQELRPSLAHVEQCRLVTAKSATETTALLGGALDRAFRNRLQMRWLAHEAAEWLSTIALRDASDPVPQSLIIATLPRDRKAIFGACPMSTDGIGLTPGNQLGLVQVAENSTEAKPFVQWFEDLWSNLPDGGDHLSSLIERLRDLAAAPPPDQVYFHILFNLFKDLIEELDEDRIVRSATGIRDTVVWNKLFKFQRDGVIGAIDKLQRFGGCIIADSVGSPPMPPVI